MNYIKILLAVIVMAMVVSLPAQVYKFAGAVDATNTFTFTATETSMDVFTDGAPVTLIQSSTYTNVNAEAGFDNFATSAIQKYPNMLTKNGANALKLTCTGVYNISILTY